MIRTNHLRIFSDPLVDQNPVTLQILGICSALAVTTSVLTALVMSLALTFVLACSNIIISAIRKHIPNSIRLIVQIVIIASLVIVADELLKAFAFGISQRLSVYVGLIVTNCIVLARAETFAMHNPPLPSLLDGLGNGAGYSIILVPIGAFRELTGSGSLLGYPVLTTVNEGGWFEPLTFMLKPAAAFFILGFTVWLIRSLRRDQIEKPEFQPQPIREQV